MGATAFILLEGALGKMADTPMIVTIISPLTIQMCITTHTMTVATTAPFRTHSRDKPKTYFVSIAATWVTKWLNANPTTLMCQTGQSLSNGKTGALSSLKPEKSYVYGSTSRVTAPILGLPMPSTAALSAQTLSTWHAAAPKTNLASVLYKITTPYNSDGWVIALACACLRKKYPTLVNDIIYGSPIGNPPPLMHTFTPPNLPANLNPMYIDCELKTEVDAGRMSGPFSIEDVHLIFRGHFRTSPLGLVEKPGKPGALRLICHLSKCDHNGESTNRWLDSDDFPTRWYSAVDCTDIVNTFLALCDLPPFWQSLLGYIQ